MIADGHSQGAGDVEGVFREVYGQAIATLIRLCGDMTLAEDAVQDAFVVATERWPRDGVPPNPAGWIITTARNRAIDDLRRAARGRELVGQLGSIEGASRDAIEPDTEDKGPVRDDLLRLIFTCCHPALRVEHQVALTLRLLGGLTVDEVARSFLVSEAAMAKRLVRAKYKIKATRIPYRVPDAEALADRLPAVLAVLYLIYNTGGDDDGRAGLRGEAIRLVRGLVGLLPDEEEAAGLLALMLLSESRMPAQTDGREFVLLSDQDRTKWDRGLIDEGHAIVRACIERGKPGPYQLQAGIQAVHCDAGSFEATDWRQIVQLYDHLLSFAPTAVIRLNRAIAVGEVEGSRAGLDGLDAVAAELDDYHLLHAARAAALRRLGDNDAARIAYERAARLAPAERDRRFLARQARELP